MFLGDEVQVTRGTGKIIPLGSIQRIMRESIEAAAQYVRFKSAELGLSQTWYEDGDVAVLGTYMGVPKEGASAGMTLATGIVSALKKQLVRSMRGKRFPASLFWVTKYKGIIAL